MKPEPILPTRRAETALLLFGVLLLAAAVFAPPLAQVAHYHAFADQRGWSGWLPHAADVLSNLPFAIAGVVGLHRLRGARCSAAERSMAALFFAGLLLTATCSAQYHWAPDDAGLALDRAGMAVAFAGLLGLAVHGRFGERAGRAVVGAVLLVAPVAIAIQARSGNLLPWALLQGGGMVLLVACAVLRPLQGVLAVRWFAVLAVYALAKACEAGDAAVFTLTGEMVSGHTLKHVVAAFAAWLVIAALVPAGRGAATESVQNRRHLARRAQNDRKVMPS